MNDKKRQYLAASIPPLMMLIAIYVMFVHEIQSIALFVMVLSIPLTFLAAGKARRPSKLTSGRVLIPVGIALLIALLGVAFAVNL